MPSTSATGAVTKLSVVASAMVDLLAATLRETVVDDGALSYDTLLPHWYRLPMDEFADAFVARCKPATHIPLKVRRDLPARMLPMLDDWYATLVAHPVIGDPARPVTVELVASLLVKKLTDDAQGIYRYLFQQASRAYWQSRVDDDGRITIGTTPSGRRKRADLESLVADDFWHAHNAAQDAARTVSLAVGGGIHRRYAREQRLTHGLTASDVQYLIAVAAGSPHQPRPIGFGITGWEGDYRIDSDGRAIHPREFRFVWPYLAEALKIDVDLDDGPLIPRVSPPLPS